MHVDNDPYNYTIEEYFPPPPEFGGLNKEKAPPRIPFVLPWSQHGDWLEMELHIHLAYPSALQPDEWPRESSGPIVQVSEMFAHHVKAEDMQNPKITSLDYRGTWNRVTPWLPWMLMGQQPGHCLYVSTMTKSDNISIIPEHVRKFSEEQRPGMLHAPTEDYGPSISSLEYYAREQTPAPALKK